MEEADAEATQLAELEFVLGIYPDFDLTLRLDPPLLDSIVNKCREFEFINLDTVWVDSYEGLMKGFSKNELFRRIVMRAACDVRVQKLLGHQTDFENTPEEEEDDSSRKKKLHKHRGEPRSVSTSHTSAAHPPLKEVSVQLEDIRYVEAVKNMDQLQQQNKRLKEELEAAIEGSSSHPYSETA